MTQAHADDVVTRYLELGLRLAAHEPELLDSYYGPEDVAERARRDPRDPDSLAVEADALLADARRDPWLAAQVLALRTIARKLAGELLPYADEVEATYGIRPRWWDEAQFTRAHALLEEALPGTGTLRERYARWLERSTLPPESFEPAVRAIAGELRRRTQRLIGLPDGELPELEFVGDRPWRGYARYLGGLRTRVSFNVEREVEVADLVHVVAHEIYPGHHTHRAWQEAELVRERGQVERTLDLLWSPEALLSEGIAELASDLVLADGGSELAAACLGSVGFAYDPHVGSVVARARRLLSPLTSNLALLVHGHGRALADVREYALRWSVQPEEQLERTIARLGERGSPGYVHCYSHGLELCRRYVRGDPRRLRALMTARVAPSEVSSPAA